MLNLNEECSVPCTNAGKTNLIKKISVVPVGFLSTIQTLILLREVHKKTDQSLVGGGGEVKIEPFQKKVRTELKYIASFWY